MEDKQTIIFSASNALCKWLKLDLQRLPQPDGKQVGVATLVSDRNTISWQVHVIYTDSWRQKTTVIAVEANSRFTLLLPFDTQLSQEGLEKAILEQWANELVSLMVKQGEISRKDTARVFTRFYQQTQNVEWYRNTDLSVNGHVIDAEQWVKDTLNGRGLDALDEEMALSLSWHINSMQKSAKGKNANKRRFYPVPLFVEDGLYRYARTLFEQDRFSYMFEQEEKVALPRQSGDVISLQEYRQRNKK